MNGTTRLPVLVAVLAVVLLGSTACRRAPVPGPVPVPPASPSQERHGERMLNDVPYRSDADGNLTELMRERCRLDLYLPDAAPGFATVVWFHGGGIQGGEKHVPEELRGHGFAVAAPNYRLHPQATAPEYIEDAAAATAWVLREIGAHGGDPSRVFVSGHSAGGYLAAMVALDKRYLAAHGIDADTLAGVVPFSGHMITHFTVRKERGIPDTRPVVDDLAPLYHVRPDAPPLVLITGDREREMLGRYEENAYMARMMKVAGHQHTTLFELDGYDHGEMPMGAYPILVREVRAAR